MSFLETVAKARAFLEHNGRVSLRALKLEFSLDDEQLDGLIDELVDVQQVAARGDKILSWVGLPAAAETRDAPRAVEAEPGSEAERRQLTVLFADLVGSTELAGQLDPEEFRDVIGAYQALCAREVARYDGTLAQYLGDGVLVYFGHPQAHEDDPIRAVHAALGILSGLSALNETIRERVGAMRDRAVEVRIGVHTGLAVVGEMGESEDRELQALGDTLNQASRLQGIAEPDTVVISEATRRLVQGFFFLEDLGPKLLKGVSQPMPVVRVIQESGFQTRLDAAAEIGFTPLVGRDQELALLIDRWEPVE